MKVVLIFDQGLAGAGGKSNPMAPLKAEKGGIGSYLMLKPHLDKIDAQVLATLYCGNEYYLANKKEVVLKMTAMVKKLNPDIVICGPCFNYLDYGQMSANIAKTVKEKTDIGAVAMMSVENVETIDTFKNDIPIIKMPKKGGTGLNESLDHLIEWMDYYYNNNPDISKLESEICY